MQYTLVENLLTPDPNDFIAQPVNVRSYDDVEIVKRIMARNTGLSQVQVKSSFDEIVKEICLIIADGGAINSSLLKAQPSIAGVFHGASDVYDAKRHSVKINLTAGASVRKALEDVKLQKTQTAEIIPFITEVSDVMSDTVNDQITPGGVIEIRGGRLKLATENTDNGVFLIDEAGQAVKLPKVMENKPARLIAIMPADLPQGTYTLEVRTSLSSSTNKEGKTIKKGRFLKELTAVVND